MSRVKPLIESIAQKHGFLLSISNSALLVSRAKQEGDYQTGALLITVWNDALRYSVGRVVFGGGVRKRMGFTVWFDQDWQPRKAVNDLEVALTNMELVEVEMAALIELHYLNSDKAEKWQQSDDIELP